MGFGSSLNPAWDQAAVEYEKRVEPFTSLFVEELLEPLLKHTPGHLLDVGCGCGLGSVIAESSGFSVMGCDGSPAMIARAQERFQGSNKNIEYLVANGLDLPFTSEVPPFDVCMGIFSVIFFESPVKGLQQMRNCLKEGGEAAIAAWGNPDETPAFQVFPSAIREIAPELAQKSKPKRIVGSYDSLFKLMTDADFVNVRIVGPVERRVHVASPHDFYDRFALTSPNVMDTLEKMDHESVIKLRERVMEIAKELGGQPDGSISIPANCYFAYGTKSEETETIPLSIDQ